MIRGRGVPTANRTATAQRDPGGKPKGGRAVEMAKNSMIEAERRRPSAGEACGRWTSTTRHGPPLTATRYPPAPTHHRPCHRDRRTRTRDNRLHVAAMNPVVARYPERRLQGSCQFEPAAEAPLRLLVAEAAGNRHEGRLYLEPQHPHPGTGAGACHMPWRPIPTSPSHSPIVVPGARLVVGTATEGPTEGFRRDRRRMPHAGSDAMRCRACRTRWTDASRLCGA